MKREEQASKSLEKENSESNRNIEKKGNNNSKIRKGKEKKRLDNKTKEIRGKVKRHQKEVAER